mmetsp:Transcript_24899/g.71140  ORF Transcript_24899/g.71140 Transcript_24899/m.71140 type:complete len:266 (+) Transcript_24899:204-1001(+)
MIKTTVLLPTAPTNAMVMPKSLIKIATLPVPARIASVKMRRRIRSSRRSRNLPRYADTKIARDRRHGCNCKGYVKAMATTIQTSATKTGRHRGKLSKMFCRSEVPKWQYAHTPTATYSDAPVHTAPVETLPRRLTLRSLSSFAMENRFWWQVKEKMNIGTTDMTVQRSMELGGKNCHDAHPSRLGLEPAAENITMRQATKSQAQMASKFCRAVLVILLWNTTGETPKIARTTKQRRNLSDGAPLSADNNSNPTSAPDNPAFRAAT